MQCDINQHDCLFCSQRVTTYSGPNSPAQFVAIFGLKIIKDRRRIPFLLCVCLFYTSFVISLACTLDKQRQLSVTFYKIVAKAHIIFEKNGMWFVILSTQRRMLRHFNYSIFVSIYSDGNCCRRRLNSMIQNLSHLCL